jgi:hypothetical protein
MVSVFAKGNLAQERYNGYGYPSHLLLDARSEVHQATLWLCL